MASYNMIVVRQYGDNLVYRLCKRARAIFNNGK